MVAGVETVGLPGFAVGGSKTVCPLVGRADTASNTIFSQVERMYIQPMFSVFPAGRNMPDADTHTQSVSHTLADP